MINYCQSEIAVGDAFITEPDIRKVLQGIKDIGGAGVRFLAAWDLLNPPAAPSTYNWVEMDRAMRLCAEYGIRPLPCVSLGYGKGGDGSTTSYANTCMELAKRYGPSGTKQIYEIEIFNEENSSLNFQPNSPAEYTKYLKAAYTAIKSVHSSCTVVIGGPIQTSDVPFIIIPVLTPPFFIIGSAVNPVSWIKGIYDAGGKDYFDACAAHYYASSTPGSASDYQWTYILGMRDLMVARGDGAKKIWITELGAAFPGNPTLVAARDLMKQQIDILQTQSYIGPIYIYSYRNASRNVDGNSVFGMVDYDFVPKSPLYEYVKTLAGRHRLILVTSFRRQLRRTPTSSDPTSTSAKLLWDPNPAIDGVTNYRVYSEAGAKITETTALFVTVSGLQPATPQKFYITAIDAAGNESSASGLVTVTTNSPAGLQEFFQYKFTGTGSALPTVFTQLGVGFSVTSGVALHNAPTSDGKYWTVAPYGLDMQSPDHSSRISLAGMAVGSDRSAMAIVRLSADGSTWIAGLSSGGNSATSVKSDSLKIVTCINGVIRVRAAKSTIPASATQVVEIVASGSAYTARIIDTAAAVVVAEVPWTDTANVFTGASNRRAGMGWQHLRVHGVNYPAPGVTEWKAADLVAVTSAGTADLWTLAITDDSEWEQIIATGLWEPAL